MPAQVRGAPLLTGAPARQPCAATAAMALGRCGRHAGQREGGNGAPCSQHHHLGSPTRHQRRGAGAQQLPAASHAAEAQGSEPGRPPPPTARRLPGGGAATPPHHAPPPAVLAPQAGDALPDVQLDELVGGEIKQVALKELFAGKKVGGGCLRLAWHRAADLPWLRAIVSATCLHPSPPPSWAGHPVRRARRLHPRLLQDPPARVRCGHTCAAATPGVPGRPAALCSTALWPASSFDRSAAFLR